MPIVLYEEKHDEQGGWMPRFICDHCGELVAGPFDIVAWDYKQEKAPIVYVAHANECDRVMKAKFGATAYLHCGEFAQKLGLSVK